MSQPASDGTVYVCPMHAGVRQPGPGTCPECGMDLLPEGTRFALLRHIMSKPLHIALMAAVMIAIVAAVVVLMPRKGF